MYKDVCRYICIYLHTHRKVGMRHHLATVGSERSRLASPTKILLVEEFRILMYICVCIYTHTSIDIHPSLSTFNFQPRWIRLKDPNEMP